MTEQVFRWLFIALFVATISISAYFRWQARKSGALIPRAREGTASMVLRSVFAVPLFLSFFVYMINPEWMGWAALTLPTWLRILAAVAGFVMLPVLYWVVITIGNNISETFLTKEDHMLVTRGPYALVRHPLYSVGTIIFVSLGVLAANWFIIMMATLSIVAIALIVVPREESQLIRKFGSEYREYMKRTGMLIPRFDLFG